MNPVFPSGPDTHPDMRGLSIRQYYKAAALTGLLARSVNFELDGKVVTNESQLAYVAGRFADTMIADDIAHLEKEEA